MAKLWPAHVQTVVDAMLAAWVAPRTTPSAHRTLHGAVKQAVRWQLLSVNVAGAVQSVRCCRC